MTRAIPNDNRMFKYDPVTDSWVQISDFPVLSQHYAETVLDNIPYVLTGDASTGDITLWRYDELNDEWNVATTEQIIGNPFCGFFVALFAINGKIYVHTSDFDDSFRSYEPATDTWEILVDANAYGECATFGFSIGEKGYLLFSAREFADVLRKELWEFDPSNGTWTQGPDYPGYTDQTFDYPETIFVIDNLAYVGMTTLESTFHRYNPVTISWETIGPCGYFGSKAAGFAIDGLGYVAGGFAHDPATGGTLSVDDVWRLNPEKLSVSESNDVGIVIHPNPVNNIVNVSGIQSDFDYQIYNLSGQLVDQGVSEGKSIRVTHLPKGLFLLSITIDDTSEVIKLLKL